MPTTQYEAPHFALGADRKLGWFLEAQQEGAAWLNAQNPTRDWPGAMEILSGPGGENDIEGLSSTGYNKTKRIARELVASLSSFRHEGEVKTSWDTQLYDRAQLLTNLDRNLYLKTKIQQSHRHALQYGVATGTAYLMATWDNHYHGRFRGDIRQIAISPADVTFVQLPKDHNIQRAYGVIYREELPINLAKAIYAPMNAAFAASLTPDRESPGWLQKGLQKVQQFMSPALRVAGRTNQQNQGSFPTVDIFHMYTLDSSVNDGPIPITMGTPGTNWSYEVPALGDPISTGIVNTATGNFFTEPATHEHCALFPLRRYTIFSRTGLGYDGSSPWWHGAVPITRLRFSDWAWESLGGSLVSDLRTMQKGIEAMMRIAEDSAAARMDPAMVYDDNIVADSWAKSVNTRMAGVRAKASLSQGDPMKPLLPPQYYDVPMWFLEYIKENENRMDYMSGVTDLVAIAKAKQVPGADTLEKLMEMAGPIVQDMVRAVEEPLTDLGNWRIAYYLQFYTRSRMITTAGTNGVPVDVQYLPEHLFKLQPGETPEQTRQRARRLIEEFHYEVTESGINEIHRMSTKLLYIQLVKNLDFPISPWTMADICQVPNFGPPPKDANTEMEKWIAWKHMQTELELEKAEQVQESGLMGAPPGAEGAPNEGPGRPASFNAPPRIVQKDGGTRSTITTSR